MASYNFTQVSPSSAWTVTHNLNRPQVACDVFVDVGGDLTKVMPVSVAHSSDNALTVTFSEAQTGVVRVLALD